MCAPSASTLWALQRKVVFFPRHVRLSHGFFGGVEVALKCASDQYLDDRR
jgi:hypothetical protein